MELEQWAPPETLAEWSLDATERLLGTVADFTDDDPRWRADYLPVINPAIWEIAHVAWFAEWFVLRQLHGREALMDHVDARYDSAAVGHRTRWAMEYPDPTRTMQYVRDVGEAMAEVVAHDQGLDSTSYFTAYAIMHHDAHVEAMTYTRQTLGWSPQPELAAAVSPTETSTSGDIEMSGGRLLLGGSRHQPFVMDNERWAHPTEVAPFAMAATTVTMAEFEAFVEDGGYERGELWTPEGAAWKAEAKASAPVYWRHIDGSWQHRVFASWRPVAHDATRPMVHVSYYEVQAYCTWAGRRLPTEAEWEFAATTGPSGDKQWNYPWGDREGSADEAALDARTGGVVPVGALAQGDGPWGHRQMIGNVWEWTDSTFTPFPHFEPDAYRDNSEPWFYTRKVLRGGSWATRSRYVRSTFRNYFEPHRRDVLAGFRTCPVQN